MCFVTGLHLKKKPASSWVFEIMPQYNNLFNNGHFSCTKPKCIIYVLNFKKRLLKVALNWNSWIVIFIFLLKYYLLSIICWTLRDVQVFPLLKKCNTNICSCIMLNNGCDFDPLELEKGWSISDKGSSTSLSRVSPTFKMTFSKGRWRSSEHLLISIWVGNNKLYHDEGYLPPSGSMYPPIRLLLLVWKWPNHRQLSLSKDVWALHCYSASFADLLIEWLMGERILTERRTDTHQIHGASRCCCAETEQELNHKQRTDIKMLLPLLAWQCSPVKTMKSTQQFYEDL